MVLHVFGRTDVGRTREHNEDAFLVADLHREVRPVSELRQHTLGERGALFMVADGMGGAAAGELASAMAVETVLHELRERWVSASTANPDFFARAIKQATEVANAKIHRYASEHPENRGMGTTATIAGLLGDTLYVAQVGDSRAYLVRDGRAWQITKDQSLTQKLVEAGEMTEEQAEASDRKNIIWQALGPEARIRIDLTHQRVRRGDTLILCSDGLSGQVRADEMGQIVQSEQDLSMICRRLIDRANEMGGPDNITVVVARFDGSGLLVAAAEDEVAHRAFTLPGEDLTPTVPVEKYTPRLTAEPAAAEGVPLAAPSPAEHRRSQMGLILLVLIAALAILAAIAVRIWRDGEPAPINETERPVVGIVAPASLPGA